MVQPETPQVRRSRDDILWMIGISGVMVLAQSPFASYVAFLPLIREEWGLSNAQAGMIYSAYQVGFSLAVLLLIPLTDRFPSRLLFLASVWGSAITNLFLPLWATGFMSGSFLRFVAGPCLVGIYVPGIRIVSERFAQGRRGMAVGLFVSAFYLGYSVSLARMSFLLPSFGWRKSYLISALLAFSGVALAHCFLRGKDASFPGKLEVSGRLTLDVFRSKPLVLMIIAYAAHAWELCVVRVWLAPFLTVVLLTQGMERTHAVVAAAGLAALMLAMGSPGPLFRGDSLRPGGKVGGSGVVAFFEWDHLLRYRLDGRRALEPIAHRRHDLRIRCCSGFSHLLRRRDRAGGP